MKQRSDQLLQNGRIPSGTLAIQGPRALGAASDWCEAMKRPSQRSCEGVIAIITNLVPIFPQAKRKFKMNNLISLCFDIVFFIVYFCLGALGFWLFGGSQ